MTITLNYYIIVNKRFLYKSDGEITFMIMN